MSAAATSLLTFLDAPVVVGDPGGRCAYVNPAFEAAFARGGDDSRGLPLAGLFEGGAREAVLRAVAKVCERGASERFRVRQGAVGYSAVASPIVAEDARVGVVILFSVTPLVEERLLGLRRELHEPLDEVARALDSMLEQTGGRRGARYRSLVEDGLRALQRIQKWSEGLDELLACEAPPPAGSACFDPAQLLRTVAARLRDSCAGAGVELELLLPGQLPPARGDGHHLESTLLRVVSARVAVGGSHRRLTLGGRVTLPARAVMLSVVDAPAAAGSAVADWDPDQLADIRLSAEAEGVQLVTVRDPGLGSVTALRIPLK